MSSACSACSPVRCWPRPFRGGFHDGDALRNKLPAELTSLADVPDAQRFEHFRGVQVTLTDKNNQPLLVNVTPGTVTAVSASSLTVNGNDGASHTYALDSKTLQDDERPIKQNDQVVVATVNNSTSATAVFATNDNGGAPAPWRRPGPGRPLGATCHHDPVAAFEEARLSS